MGEDPAVQLGGGRSMMSRLRKTLGACIRDLPAYLPPLITRGGWVRVCNPGDELELGPEGKGVRICAPWGSTLDAPRALPFLGSRLGRRAFSQWPIEFGNPADALATDSPEVSVVISFRGADRLPQLRSVLRSLLSQRDVSLECILVEQGADVVARDVSPHVRHVHLPHPHSDHWFKSWAYNVGARMAKGRALVFHDADVCMPQGYLREVRDLIDAGVETVALGRFLFYLGRGQTEIITRTNELPPRLWPDVIRQNWTGPTVAISAEAFGEIGGYDEGFVNWSAEDNEFYLRAVTRRSWLHRYLPFVHLWHPPQPDRRHILEQEGVMERLSVPASQRIAELGTRRWGDPNHPPEPNYRYGD